MMAEEGEVVKELDKFLGQVENVLTEDAVFDRDLNLEEDATKDVYSFECLLEKAKQMEKEGQTKWAAHYYLFCVDNFKNQGRPLLIAECLHRLGNLAYKEGKMEMAAQCRHAERLMYEARLLQVEIIERRRQKEGPQDLYREATGEEKAMAWESLAQSFFEKKQLEMAAKFALKAIQLRRAHQKGQEVQAAATTSEKLAQEGRSQYETALRQFLADGGALSVETEDERKCRADIEPLQAKQSCAEKDSSSAEQGQLNAQFEQRMCPCRRLGVLAVVLLLGAALLLLFAEFLPRKDTLLAALPLKTVHEL